MNPMIASQTNPWVEVDGVPVTDWAERFPVVECPCDLMGAVVIPGVIHSMDTPEGIQRCDACDLFEGDLEAAAALAELVGGVVCYTPADEDVIVLADGDPEEEA